MLMQENSLSPEWQLVLGFALRTKYPKCLSHCQRIHGLTESIIVYRLLLFMQCHQCRKSRD